MAKWPTLFSKSGRGPQNVRPSSTLYFWLAGAFLLTLVPHVAQLPVWVTAAVLLAIIVRSFMEFYRLPLPSNTFTAVLALCLLGGIFLQFNTAFGRDAGTAFMAGLLAIKFFELRGPRDVAMIVFSCFFVVMSSLLFSQAIELFVYCLIMMWLLTGVLLRSHMGDTPGNRLLFVLRTSALIVFQALPLALFLFFFFPRYSGKFQLGLDDTSLGLSGIVEPGSISRLAQNDSPAMEVSFPMTDNIPDVSTLYWRALVMWTYENGVWSPGAISALKPKIRPVPARDTRGVTQLITIYPNFQKWLYALDYPTSLAQNAAETEEWSTILKGDVLQLAGPQATLDHIERYTVLSSPALGGQELTPDVKQSALQIHLDEIDPRVVALAKELRDKSPTDKDYIYTVLHYYRHEHFTYTDTPGADEAKKWLADFLFVTRKGFCEHFAASFAVLMRLGGFPARVVVGYQGGEYNPYGNFYMVRQSNAHAWDEVWIAGEKRWMRVDPTSILSTAEITPPAGSGNNRDDSGDALSVRMTSRSSFYGQPFPDWMRRALIELQLRREQVEAGWNDWVFSYNPEAQSRLAQAMGLGRNSQLGLGAVCLLALTICVVLLRHLMKKRRVSSPVEQLYAQFCRNMALRGIPRSIWEGPLAYAGRVAEAFPEKRDAVQTVGLIIAQTRYGRVPADPSAARELKSLLALITASQAASSSREQI